MLTFITNALSLALSATTDCQTQARYIQACTESSYTLDTMDPPWKTDMLSDASKVRPPPDLSLRHHEPEQNDVEITISRANHKKRYMIPRATIDFWSPALRNILDRATRAHNANRDLPGSPVATLYNTDPDVFETMMQYWKTSQLDPKLTSPDCSGMSIMGTGNVPLIIKIWVFANLLGGPSLVARDTCMEIIYRTYTTKPDLLSPTVVTFVLQHIHEDYAAESSNGRKARLYRKIPLVNFFLAILTPQELNRHLYGGVSSSSLSEEGQQWMRVMDDFPVFKDEIYGPCNKHYHFRSGDFAGRWKKVELQLVEKYYVTVAEVTPGWSGTRDDFGRL